MGVQGHPQKLYENIGAILDKYTHSVNVKICTLSLSATANVHTTQHLIYILGDHFADVKRGTGKANVVGIYRPLLSQILGHPTFANRSPHMVLSFGQ